jgi:hypothetical protein
MNERSPDWEGAFCFTIILCNFSLARFKGEQKELYKLNTKR